ncbi:MAG: type VI secretion system tip protein VgrG [Polyangiaceae bacterium]|nr:type VI secretion system tip protein VgrG [Polyangiaceae bacterium]
MKDTLHVRVASAALPADRVELHTLSGHEAISKLFEFELLVVVRGTAELDERAVLAAGAELIFERGGGEVARMAGQIAAIRESLQTEADHLAYTLTFVPRAHRLHLAETSEIFMDRSVVDIVKEKLVRAGLAEGDDFELRLRASYPPREFVVQYKETDLAFISRLTEHHGISFFFEHRNGRDVMVLTDDNGGFRPVAGGAVPFSPRGEAVGVFALERTTRTLPNRYVVKDYNYRTPQVSLTASATLSDAGGDVVEHGAHFKTPEEAKRTAAIRAEELLARRTVFEGRSDAQTLRAGARFHLDGHPRADQELLVVEVRHRAEQGALGAGAQASYKNDFVAIPAKTTFRPARVTPKPRVHGVLTGVIESAGGGQYAEVDDEGRYRVRFQFDTGGAPQGKASRPIRMAQPHAGPGYGIHFPLRHGVEVLLTCVDGDPDRPIISGAVPNPVTPSPVTDDNARRNVIRTGGGSEINIDDLEGSSRIKLTTPYGNTTLQLGAPNHPGKGAVLETGEDVLIAAKGKIDALAEAEITISAGANLNESAPWIDVSGGEKIRQGAPVIELNAGPTLDAGADAVKIVGRSSLTAESPTITVSGGSITVVFAGATLVLHGGADVHITSATVTVEGGTVDVSGDTVNIKGAGEVNVNAGTIKLNA